MKPVVPVGSWRAWECEDTHKIVELLSNGVYRHYLPPPVGTLVYVGEVKEEDFDMIFTPMSVCRYEGTGGKKQWGPEYLFTHVLDI